VGTLQSHRALVEHSTASGLVHPQPKPGSRITIYLGLASEEKIFFSLVVAGRTQNYDLAISSQVL